MIFLYWGSQETKLFTASHLGGLFIHFFGRIFLWDTQSTQIFTIYELIRGFNHIFFAKFVNGVSQNLNDLLVPNFYRVFIHTVLLFWPWLEMYKL